MGEITIERVAEQSLTLFVSHGRVTAAELAQGIERFYAEGATRHVLWDFTQADLSGIQREDVHGLVEKTLAYRAQRPAGRTALVFSSELGFGLGRMFDSLQGVAENPVEHRSFRDAESARRWLLAEAEGP